MKGQGQSSSQNRLIGKVMEEMTGNRVCIPLPDLAVRKGQVQGQDLGHPTMKEKKNIQKNIKIETKKKRNSLLLL
jgi:hypothetical protein